MPRNFHFPDPAALLAMILPAIEEAGAMIRAEFHRPGGPRGRGHHAPIDDEVEAHLRRSLLALHDCGWHGEETPPLASRHPDCWVVDPQDGTRAFLKGLRGPAISVALLRHGQPVLGVVLAPTAPDDRGDLFTWAEGAPLCRNGVVQGRLLPQGLSAATVLAMNEEAGDYAAQNHSLLAPAGIRAIPSIAYRLALAAVGEVDAALSLTQALGSHDIAGGHALLIGAGGQLVQLSGAPIRHGGKGFDGCIGGRAGLVAEIVARRPGRGTREPRRAVAVPRRLADPLVLDRAQGALLGLLAGDALGSQVEFLAPETIRARFPQGVTALLPGGTWGLVTGQPTDDGEMALALARSLVAAGGHDPQAVGAAYVAWGRSHPFDMGGTTRAGLAALAGRGRANAASQANGALMRAAPIGLAAAGQPQRAAAWGRADAQLTHPHPVCQAANAAFSAAIAVGVAGGDARAMLDAALAACGDDPDEAPVTACLARAADLPPPEAMAQQGWVLIALQNAFHHLGRATPLAQALPATVALGGDTDTNAAICGALLGAAQGRSALPLRWQSQILGCRSVAAPHVLHPRPPAFWPDDAADLAEALAALSQT